MYGTDVDRAPSHQKETKMDLWRLKIFRRVIEHNSFSKAAEGLNLSQPTVSSHIKDLERHFDVKLIDRLSKVAPNPHPKGRGFALSTL